MPVLLHGGMICPLEIASFLASIPFLRLLWVWYLVPFINRKKNHDEVS